MKKVAISVSAMIGLSVIGVGCSAHKSSDAAASTDQLVECYGVGKTDAPVLMPKKFCDVLPASKQVVVTTDDYVQCYGVAAAGKNDCATASVSCGGKVTVDRAPDAWVSVPRGICENLKGSTIKAAK